MYKKKSTRSGLENIIVVKMLHVVLARTIVEQLELIFVFLWLRVCVKSRNPMDPNLSRSLTAFFATAERLKPSAIEMHHAFLLCMSTMYLPLQQFFCQVRVHRPWPTHSKHGKLVEAVRLITRESWNYEGKDKTHPWNNPGSTNYKSDNKKSSWNDWHPEESEEEFKEPPDQP